MRWTRQRRARACLQGGSHREQTVRARRTALSVRQNRVVPTPVAGAKLSVANLIQPDRSVIKPTATEARRIRLRGERGISRKAIAQGTSGCSVCTCMLVCAFLSASCTRDRGCSKHPAFPAPSHGRNATAQPGRSRRGNANAYLLGCLKCEQDSFHVIACDKREAFAQGSASDDAIHLPSQ